MGLGRTGRLPMARDRKRMRRMYQYVSVRNLHKQLDSSTDSCGQLQKHLGKCCRDATGQDRLLH
eukprot:1479983-Amphidinium_carterae.1